MTGRKMTSVKRPYESKQAHLVDATCASGVLQTTLAQWEGSNRVEDCAKLLIE